MEFILGQSHSRVGLYIGDSGICILSCPSKSVSFGLTHCGGDATVDCAKLHAPEDCQETLSRKLIHDALPSLLLLAQ